MIQGGGGVAAEERGYKTSECVVRDTEAVVDVQKGFHKVSPVKHLRSVHVTPPGKKGDILYKRDQSSLCSTWMGNWRKFHS